MEFSCFQGFPEFSFKDREYDLNFVSLMVPRLVEGSSEFSTIDPIDPLSFSGSDLDEFQHLPYSDLQTSQGYLADALGISEKIGRFQRRL